MISMGSAAVNNDGSVEGGRPGDCGLVPRKFENLWTAFPTGAGSLKPRGDMAVLRKVVHHRMEASVRDRPGSNCSGPPRRIRNAKIIGFDISESPTPVERAHKREASGFPDAMCKPNFLAFFVSSGPRTYF